MGNKTNKMANNKGHCMRAQKHGAKRKLIKQKDCE